MAATQTAEPHPARTRVTPARTLSLFLVLLVARAAAQGVTGVPLSIWTLPALVWQDALVALLFGLMDRLVNRGWIGWAMYGASVFYIAVNVGVERALRSPLTWNMLRAAGGPLADSAWSSLTFTNLSAIAVTGVAAGLCPWLLYRLRWTRTVLPMTAMAAALAALGPYATTQVDLAGRHRNAFGALWPAGVPRTAGAAPDSDWRSSPVDVHPPDDDLTRFHGVAAGRNVIIVILESTAAEYLRPYGAELDPMPNLTGAARGIVFENAFAVYPESIKGLFSILCSRYPAFNSDAREYSRTQCPALPSLFAAAGYRTALIHSGRFMYLGMNEVIENRGFQTLEDAGAIGGVVESSFGVDEPAAVARLLSFIDAAPDRPFFAMYLPTAGHHPYATPSPGPFPDDGGIGSYRNALRYGDESLGALFSGLRRRGLDRDTMIVVFGDHGEAFGQHAGNFAHTMFVYNENVRVPYAIIAPGLLPEIRVSRAVSLIDTAPTILDLAGLPIPPEYQGASMLDPRPRMALFFTDYSLGWLGLVDGCWKALYETGAGHFRLFDICRDPGERVDLSARNASRASAYRARLEGWIAAQRIP
jgi:hypothetical protein